MEKERQSKILELNMLDAQLKQLEQQAMMIEQQIFDQQSLITNLDELKKSKKGQEMLFQLSRNVFAEGNLKNSNEVLVNVGSNVIVKKNIEEAKKITERAKLKLVDLNEDIRKEMQNIIFTIVRLEKDLQCNDPNCTHENH